MSTKRRAREWLDRIGALLGALDDPRRLAPAAFVVGLLTLLPWTFLFRLWTYTADHTRWLQRGDPSAADFWERVLLRPHDQAWRPLFVASFGLTRLLGLDPWPERLRDSLIPLAPVVLVALVGRRLVGLRGRIALMAALLYGAHPVMEEVIAYPERRTYGLASLLGAVGLLEMEAAVRRRPLAWLLCPLLLVLAQASNELAYAAVGAALLWGAILAPRPAGQPRPWGTLALVVVSMLGVLALRFHALGGLGGYGQPWVAEVINGRRALSQVSEPAHAAALEQAAAYIALPDAGLTAGNLPNALTLGLLLAFAVPALVSLPALQAPGDAKARGPALIAAWLGGGFALIALSGTWFWRMGHPSAIPWILLVAVLIDRATAPSARRRVLNGLVAVLAVLAIGQHSPMVGRTAERRYDVWARATPLMQQIGRELDDAEEPARIWLALPFYESDVTGMRAWLGERWQGRKRRVMALAWGQRGGPCKVETGGAWPALMPARGCKLFDVPAKMVDSETGLLPLAALRGGTRDSWLYLVRLDAHDALRIDRWGPGEPTGPARDRFNPSTNEADDRDSASEEDE